MHWLDTLSLSWVAMNWLPVLLLGASAMVIASMALLGVVEVWHHWSERRRLTKHFRDG